MRLPADAALIVAADADAATAAALLAAWRAQDLPVFADADDLEAALEESGVTTLVVCGGGAAGVKAAENQGYRVFVVAEALAPAQAAELQGGEARIVSLAQTLLAVAGARIRERLRAARGGG